MAKRASADSEGNWSEDLSVGHSLVKSTGRWGRVSRGHEKVQPGGQEGSQERAPLEARRRQCSRRRGQWTPQVGLQAGDVRSESRSLGEHHGGHSGLDRCGFSGVTEDRNLAEAG